MKKSLVVFLLLVPLLTDAADLPSNSHPNIYGSGWTCNKGYKKSGLQCEKVIVPDNASIDYTGSGWACNKGYKKLNNSCVVMTKEEMIKQNEQEQAVLKILQEHRLKGVRGDDCKTDFKTNAEVCVHITSVNLDCNKSAFGTYYDNCNATVRYDVNTNYAGGSYLDVDVECKVVIEYKGRRTYSTQSDSSRKSESYSLHAHGSDSERMNFSILFSHFNEVTSAKIDSVKCEIEEVELR